MVNESDWVYVTYLKSYVLISALNKHYIFNGVFVY